MQKLLRAVFYFSGLIILSLGIILNTKSAFGVTPIISIAYCLSLLHNWNFGNASFVMYCVLAVIEYLVKGKRFRAIDLLQIPLSVVLTRFFNLFGAVLPDVTSLPARILCLILGIALTGIGAAMNVDTRLIPNPGDGIVQAIADRLGKKMGNVKNVFDLFCVTLTILLGVVSTGHPVGVGIGTIAAMIGVGRFIWIYNRLFQQKQLQLTGVEA
ncbi:MAG: DUF6198 family protein [Lachnospiraceae bacterium]|jgi:uncharacterized membrane protein YczE|nr:DUF6198 family protein [Lachnospiraceae bacterium]MDD5849737.1 DUF6198 family protein [Bacillota bacterium]